MSDDPAVRQIEAEFATAHRAGAAGNDGMVRVCARRAAGIAIGCWLARHPRTGWTADALGRLRSVAADSWFPEGVRRAAHRLTMRVKEDFTAQSELDPIADARAIIEHCMNDRADPDTHEGSRHA
jgi:hypothetical protein